MGHQLKGLKNSHSDQMRQILSSQPGVLYSCQSHIVFLPLKDGWSFPLQKAIMRKPVDTSLSPSQMLNSTLQSLTIRLRLGLSLASKRGGKGRRRRKRRAHLLLGQARFWQDWLTGHTWRRGESCWGWVVNVHSPTASRLFDWQADSPSWELQSLYTLHWVHLYAICLSSEFLRRLMIVIKYGFKSRKKSVKI